MRQYRLLDRERLSSPGTGVMEQGVGKVMKKAFTGEGMTLMRCEGREVLFLFRPGETGVRG